MSPASYRAAPPRVGEAILCPSIDKDQIHAITRMDLVFIVTPKYLFDVNYFLVCALIAESSADFNRFCALS